VTNRDLREGGAWTRAQTAKNALLYVAVRASLLALSSLPRRWLRRLGRALGGAAFWLVPSAKRTALANVARVFPAEPRAARRALVRRAYGELGEHLGDTLALLRGDVVRLPLADGAARALDDARRARGVVFASAHLGPWETVAASLVASGVPLTTIARESYDPRLTRLYERLRAAHGVGAIYRGRAGAAARILRTLRDRRVLGVPMDLRARVPAIDVPFLGHPAPTPVGPARIALRSGAAVVVGTAARSARGELCVSVTVIPSADLAPGAEGERILTTRINDELSRRILALPEAWPWMHARWAEGAGG
jgi:KDO2-lipid IV(A) lauroyltransferase